MSQNTFSAAGRKLFNDFLTKLWFFCLLRLRIQGQAQIRIRIRKSAKKMSIVAVWSKVFGYNYKNMYMHVNTRSTCIHKLGALKYYFCPTQNKNTYKSIFLGLKTKNHYRSLIRTQCELSQGVGGGGRSTPPPHRCGVLPFYTQNILRKSLPENC